MKLKKEIGISRIRNTAHPLSQDTQNYTPEKNDTVC